MSKSWNLEEIQAHVIPGRNLFNSILVRTLSISNDKIPTQTSLKKIKRGSIQFSGKNMAGSRF